MIDRMQRAFELQSRLLVYSGAAVVLDRIQSRAMANATCEDYGPLICTRVSAVMMLQVCLYGYSIFILASVMLLLVFMAALRLLTFVT